MSATDGFKRSSEKAEHSSQYAGWYPIQNGYSGEQLEVSKMVRKVIKILE